MLKSIDILIGVAVVMLVVSAVVTALTQFVVYLMQSKGKNLRTGIADLLQLIAPNFTRACAEEIAGQILLHPLVRQADGKLSDAIHREELVKIILELAYATEGHTLTPENRQALMNALEKDGIKDPEKILENTRSMLLQLELTSPELSNAMRSNIALLQEAQSAFLAKIHAWFDQTIDRTVDRFTTSTRAVTFACAAGVVLFLQLDTIALINQLSLDEQLRNTMVQHALQIDARGTPPSPATTTTPETPGPKSAMEQLRADIDENKDQVKDLASLGLIRLPHSFNDWANQWRVGNSIVKVFGLLMSAILLSLGAPFWYNALKTLLKFRSVVAAKDDDQRKERQKLTPDGEPARAPALAAAAAAGGGPAALTGERGFLG